MIKRLVVTTCQTVDSHPIIHCYETYTLCKHYHNPYLTTDLQRKKKELNCFCECLTDALCSKFDIGANFFVSKKKKKIIHISLKKPLIHYPFYKEIISFIRKYWEERKY